MEEGESFPELCSHSARAWNPSRDRGDLGSVTGVGEHVGPGLAIGVCSVVVCGPEA